MEANASDVRSQARKVRSSARWSRATLPLFSSSTEPYFSAVSRSHSTSRLDVLLTAGPSSSAPDELAELCGLLLCLLRFRDRLLPGEMAEEVVPLGGEPSYLRLPRWWEMMGVISSAEDSAAAPPLVSSACRFGWSDFGLGGENCTERVRGWLRASSCTWLGVERGEVMVGKDIYRG